MSLRRKPEAPARRAPKTYSSSSKVVSTSTFVAERVGSATIRAVASSPSSRGIRMSMSTTSGLVSTAWATASSPSTASPTTSMSSSESSNARNPARTSAWSSATSTRITARPSARRRQRRHDPPPAARQGPASNVPPAAWARSRIPRTPCPAPAGAPDDPSPPSSSTSITTASSPRSPGRGRETAACRTHVRERLLHDPVAGRGDRRRQARGRRVDVEVHLDPGGAQAVAQLVELAQALRRPDRCPVPRPRPRAASRASTADRRGPRR